MCRSSFAITLHHAIVNRWWFRIILLIPYFYVQKTMKIKNRWRWHTFINYNLFDELESQMSWRTKMEEKTHFISCNTYSTFCRIVYCIHIQYTWQWKLVCIIHRRQFGKYTNKMLWYSIHKHTIDMVYKFTWILKREENKISNFVQQIHRKCLFRWQRHTSW